MLHQFPRDQAEFNRTGPNSKSLGSFANTR
jgi:hypothetical protein